jgi:hypothetical protein
MFKSTDSPLLFLRELEIKEKTQEHKIDIANKQIEIENQQWNSCCFETPTDSRLLKHVTLLFFIVNGFLL